MSRLERKLVLGLLVAELTLCCQTESCLAGTYLDIKLTPDSTAHALDNGPLRADALEAAELLRVRPLVEKLRTNRAEHSGVQLPPELLKAKYLCLLRILSAREEVRKVVMAIKKDLAFSYESLEALTTRNNTAQSINNSMNFMQAGVIGSVKQGLLIEHVPNVPGYLLTTTFATGTGLSALNLLFPYATRNKIDRPPNSLHHFLDLTYNPPDADKNFLWRFFNSPVPGSKDTLTRREILIRHFDEFQGLNIRDKARLKRLTNWSDKDETLYERAGLVMQRVNLLYDLRSHVEEFDTSLYELHKSITAR
jgi:hypothetical protein